jgi:hypothetical protein
VADERNTRVSDSALTIAPHPHRLGAGALAPGTLDPAVVNPILDKLSADVAAFRDAVNNPPCSVTFDPPSLYYGAQSGRVKVTLTALEGCKWTVKAPDWVTVTPSSGTGSKTIVVEATTNTGAMRKGTIAIGTGSMAITQEAVAIVPPPPPPPPPPTTGDIVVPAGGDIQKALDTIEPGRTVWLVQGATYKTNLIIANRAFTGKKITLRTQGIDDAALPPGKRINPADPIVAKFAKLVPLDPLFPTLSAARGAHDHEFIGIEFGGNTVHPDRDLIQFNVDQTNGAWYTALEDQPINFTFDRVYIHAEPAFGGHRGILADGANMKIINSDIRGFWEQGRDSQAIGIFSTKGPLLVENNYLEGSGENMMVGGSDPVVKDWVPSDITVRFNHFFKPLEWKPVYKAADGTLSDVWSAGASLVSGKPGSVKNIFELKNARRVLVEYNVFENNWSDAQSGNAIVFTVRNQNGAATWCTIQDVLFQHNLILNNQNYAFNILARDNHFPSVPMAGVRIIDNLVLGTRAGFLIGEAMESLELAHNTLIGIVYAWGALSADSAVSGTNKMRGLVVRDNVTREGDYGFTGNNTGAGTLAFDTYAEAYKVAGNVIEGTNQRAIRYPAGNFMLSFGTLMDRLDAKYQYTGPEMGTDGVKPGANVDGILAKLPWFSLPAKK